MTEVNQVMLRPDWSGVAAVPLQAVNQFATQPGAPAGPNTIPDGIVLVAGTASPPILQGSEAEILHHIEALQGKLPVHVIANMVMSRERAEELVSYLQTAIAQYDAVVEASKANRG